MIDCIKFNKTDLKSRNKKILFSHNSTILGEEDSNLKVIVVNPKPNQINFEVFKQIFEELNFCNYLKENKDECINREHRGYLKEKCEK